MTTYLSSYRVGFTGSRSGTESLTWSQEWIRQVMEKLGPGAGHTSLSVQVDVPAECGVPEVLSALRTLVERYEALRTTVSRDGAGRPVQAVAAAGDLVVHTLPVPADGTTAEALDALADTVVTDLRQQAFGPAELPLRIVVLGGERPRRIILVLSHLAVDIWSCRLLREDLRRLLAAPPDNGPAPGPGPLQPVDRARYERTDPVRRRSENALRYWVRQLHRFPATLFPGPPRPAETPRYQQTHLESTAVARALRVLAARYGVTPPAVFLAAVAVRLAHRSRSDRCGLLVMTANRSGAGTGDMVGPLMQLTPVCVEVGGLGLGDVARSAHRESVAAYKHGQYDILRLPDALEEVRHLRGIDVDTSCIVNVVHEGGPAGPDDAPADAVAALVRETRRWSGQGFEHEDLGFYLDAATRSELTRLRLRTDTTLVPSAGSVGFLAGLERFLVGAVDPVREAATAVELLTDTDPAGVEHVGAGPELDLVDGCWVDVRVVRELLADALRPRSVGVFRTGAEGEGAVEAYLWPRDGGLTPAAAHARCLAALPGRAYAMTPSRYVICGSAPSTPDSLAAWRAQPVLAEGSGRRDRGEDPR